MQAAKHILVIRFSAMGDVAMSVPVIKNLLDQHPQVRVTIVSNAFFQPMFDGLERCQFHPAYLNKQHKGLAGMYRLYRELTAGNQFDAIADLHGVLRASILSALFKFNGISATHIDKGRAEKKALTRRNDKQMQPLKSSHQRYADVFSTIGFPVQLNQQHAPFTKQAWPPHLTDLKAPGQPLVGIAPFAQHAEKMYPLAHMKQVVQLLSKEHTVLLFGGGDTEKNTLQQWADEMNHVHNVAGRMSFSEELTVISNLTVMLSMDSANMHLASLFGVPVVSIWGATHPFAGFYGWAQSTANIVSIDLNCRPCSVFGNKPCFRGDHACMNEIPTLSIVEAVKRHV